MIQVDPLATSSTKLTRNQMPFRPFSLAGLTSIVVGWLPPSGFQPLMLASTFSFVESVWMKPATVALPSDSYVGFASIWYVLQLLM